MSKLLVLGLLEELLGKGYEKKKDDVAFFCPFCNHRKKKLEVNLTSHKWNCWVCHTRGKTFRSLFTRVSASPNHIIKLKQLVGEESTGSLRGLTKTNYSHLTLPPEYLPLWKKPTNKIHPVYNRALRYCLEERKLSLYDIIKYKLGYCEEGTYANRIIVPSYDSAGILNMFTGRGLYDNMYPKYLLPDADKDIIFFEIFINWKEPITLVEGPFDAIAIKRNVIPTLGTSLARKLVMKLIEEKVTELYIGYDPDARKQSIEITEHLIKQGINVHFVDLPDDPGELGFEKVTPILKNTKSLTMSDLVSLKFTI